MTDRPTPAEIEAARWWLMSDDYDLPGDIALTIDSWQAECPEGVDDESFIEARARAVLEAAEDD